MDASLPLLQRIPPADRPWVTLSFAQSVDGCIAKTAGQSLLLSCPQSLHLTHQLRSLHQAILVGIGTVLADNPRLNVRHVVGTQPQPIVMDSQLRIPPTSQLLRARPWVYTTMAPLSPRAQALSTAGAVLRALPADSNGRIDLPSMLADLRIAGIQTLMVEGGGQIISSFLQHGLVDQLVLTVAPRWLAGYSALGELQRSVCLQQVCWQRFGVDWVLFAQPEFL